MIEFNCTVKDLFRRRDMISKAVWSLADNDYAEHAVIYVRIRTNLINALAYAAANMKDHEYRVAAAYLKSDDSEQTVAQNMYYTLRTVRRYVRKACELINEYYTNELGIRLLPVDTRAIDCRVSPGSFWEKVNSLMDSSIENACAVIVHFSEHMSVSYISNNNGMGGDKVKRIVKDFGAVVTAYDIPSEKRSAV